MSKENVDVIIDVHEPSEITGAVDRHPEVSDYHFKELPASDLEIAGVGFERKTIEDYASSLTSQRLTDQTRKLGQRHDHAYILIEGDMVATDSPFKSDIRGESLRGSMASLTAREDSGVNSVIMCSNSSLLVDMAVRLARKHVEESDKEFVPKPVDDPDVDTAVQMYACIDGVGPKTAKKIHEEFPTIAKFFKEVDYDTLISIDGIGEKTALRIIQSLIDDD